MVPASLGKLRWTESTPGAASSFLAVKLVQRYLEEYVLKVPKLADLCTFLNALLQVVSCTGNYGHNYPFGDGNWTSEKFIEASRIIWKFMKEHPKLG